MKGSRTYLEGVDSLSRKIIFRTVKAKNKNYLYVNGELFFESSRFETVLEIFNGMNVRGDNNED